jgi:hypothetical protein
MLEFVGEICVTKDKTRASINEHKFTFKDTQHITSARQFLAFKDAHSTTSISGQGPTSYYVCTLAVLLRDTLQYINQFQLPTEKKTSSRKYQQKTDSQL